MTDSRLHTFGASDLGYKVRLLEKGFHQILVQTVDVATLVRVEIQGRCGKRHFIVGSPYLGSDGGGFPMLVSGGKVAVSGIDPELELFTVITVWSNGSEYLYCDEIIHWSGYVGLEDIKVEHLGLGSR